MSNAKDNIILSGINIRKEFVLKKQYLIGKPIKIFTALDGVCVNLYRGKTLGIVGESGSGKSTMGEILGNLQHPTSGDVLFCGKSIYGMLKKEYMEYRKNVQFIFQDPKGSMNPYMKIKDIISEPLKILGISRNESEIEKKVDNILECVGLENLCKSRYPMELSGGQCQRITIARALVLKPMVIICDEPVSALDVSVQAQILNLLKDLQKEFNMSYLFISHDIGVVNYMADDISVMYNGNIVEEGDSMEVLRNPGHKYTKELLDSSSFLKDESSTLYSI